MASYKMSPNERDVFNKFCSQVEKKSPPIINNPVTASALTTTQLANSGGIRKEMIERERLEAMRKSRKPKDKKKEHPKVAVDNGEIVDILVKNILLRSTMPTSPVIESVSKKKPRYCGKI